MNASLVEIPTEIRLLIFSSSNLRDISRLRQCSLVLKNNLQDLSFLKVLDFSYSPLQFQNITSAEFSHLLHNRINAGRNNIIKVKFDRMTLDLRDLEGLFRILPGIKHIRYRGFSAKNLRFFLQQENLESISYDNIVRLHSWQQLEEFSLKCTKLMRLKVCKHAFKCEVQPTEAQKNEEIKLLELNPGLKNDVNFLKLALKRNLYFYYMEANQTNVINYVHTIMDSVLASTDIRIFKWFWQNMHEQLFERMMNDDYYGQKMLTKTINWIRTLPASQWKTDHLVHTVCYKIGQCTNQYDFIKPIAQLYEYKSLRKKADKSMVRFAKRPFHENYLNDVLEYFKVRALQMKFPSIDAFEEELTSVISKLGSTEVPWQFKVIQANVLVWRGQYQEAYKAYYSLIDPHLTIDNTTVYGLQAATLIGAYHMAKDYLKSADLLQQLKALNSSNFDTIVKEYTRCQTSYDNGRCTAGTKSFFPQYVYTCMTCASESSTTIFCYSCTKKCHANHQVLYHRLNNTMCDCDHGR